MKIMTEREYRERMFDAIERADRERRLERDMLDVQATLYELKTRIERLEHKEGE